MWQRGYRLIDNVLKIKEARADQRQSDREKQHPIH